MSKEDWIILRLVCEALRPLSPLAYTKNYRKAGEYLVEKYGRGVVLDCFDQLKEETNHD